jgi:hypothetical protein
MLLMNWLNLSMHANHDPLNIYSQQLQVYAVGESFTFD